MLGRPYANPPYTPMAVTGFLASVVETVEVRAGLRTRRSLRAWIPFAQAMLLLAVAVAIMVAYAMHHPR